MSARSAKPVVVSGPKYLVFVLQTWGYMGVFCHTRWGILIHMERTADSRSVSNEARMVFPSLPVGDATLDQLQDRVQSTIRAENQLAGIRAEALAEMTRREGVHLAENDLRETGLRARRKARSEVETAQALEELPQTSEGLRKGTDSL